MPARSINSDLICFNPLPAFRPGDTHPSFWKICQGNVSIHSRRLGREILAQGTQLQIANMRFNPLPAFRPGDTVAPKATLSQVKCFNPLPAFRPGDTIVCNWIINSDYRFNPLPAFRPGDTKLNQKLRGYLVCFNPLPAFRPGDTSSFGQARPISQVSIHSRRLGREILGCWIE